MANVVSRRAAASRLDIAPTRRAVLWDFSSGGASEPVIWISSGPVEGAIANATAPFEGFRGVLRACAVRLGEQADGLQTRGLGHAAGVGVHLDNGLPLAVVAG